MDAAEINALLVETLIASSVAIAFVLLLRRPLRARFGAATGYAAWLLVLAALIAVLLPAAATAPASVSTLLEFVHAAPQAVASDAPAMSDRSAALSVVWAMGVVAMAIWFAIRQRRFLRAIGPLRRRADGLQQASASRGLPAAIGLWRPRIVVPADFERRYSPEQQALLAAHERSHIRRGDLWANALLAALRCLLWFNPLLHLATRHFRHDQELACDQRVIARHPHSRYAYGQAMFKTQLATQALPLGCHWGCGHPLKERIEMLKQPVPGTSRWVAGSVAVAMLTLAFGFTAWAAQPASLPAPVVETAMPSVPSPPAAPSPPPAPAAAPTPDAPLPPPPPPALDAPPPPPAPDAPPPPPAPAPPVPQLPPPPYPAAAVKQHISGVVVLVIDVDARGKPVDIVVERSEPAGVFDQAAVEAAWRWKFTPEVEGGKPVASRLRVPVDFKIPPGKGGAASQPAQNRLSGTFR